MSAFIKLFETCTGKYLYDVGTNRILCISDNEYKYLWFYKSLDNDTYCDKFKADPFAIEIINRYVSAGYLSDKHPKNIIHPYNCVVKDILSKKINIAIFQITQMCNLRCSYCPYSGNGFLDRKHINKFMDYNIAKKSVDFIVNNGSFSEEFNIGFYGGEPLIKFDLIEKIVSYFKIKAGGKKVKYFITTNGTLMSKEILQFLNNNNFSVTISLDGPEHIHDKNRRNAIDGKGSFRKIYSTLETIFLEYPALARRININAVWDMEESYDEITTFFSEDIVMKNFEYSIVPVDNSIIDITFSMVNSNHHQSQLWETISILESLGLDCKPSFKGNTSVMMFLRKIQEKLIPRAEIPDKCHYGGMCLPGFHRLFIDVDGFFLPCEKVSANSSVAKIGDVNSGFDYENIKKIMNVGSLTEAECKNCWCGEFCTSCFKFVDDLNCMSREKKLNECKNIKRDTIKNMKEYVIYQETKRIIEENSNI